MTELPADYDASLTARRKDLRTLRACGREFARHRSPQVIVAGVLAVGAGRIKAGRWSRHDALVPPTILALQPFSEWVIHKYLLHLPPPRRARWQRAPDRARPPRPRRRRPAYPVLSAGVPRPRPP